MLIQFLNPDFYFDDARGSLVQLVHDGWKQVNVIRSEAGVTRGGHYHASNTEAFYVISGTFSLIVEDGTTGQQETYTLKKGDFFLVPQNIIHSFHYLQETLIVSLYDQGVELPDGTKDILTKKYERV